MSSARPARFAPRPPTGQDFEDYFLKRELLMGIFEKGFVLSSAAKMIRPWRSSATSPRAMTETRSS